MATTFGTTVGTLGTTFGTAAAAVPGRLALTARAVVLAACLVLAPFSPEPWRAVLAVLGVAACAALAVLAERGSRLTSAARVLETLACAAAIPASGKAGSPLLPYLAAAVFAAGSTAGTAAALRMAGLAALVLTAAVAAAGVDGAGGAGGAVGWTARRPLVLACAEWVVVAGLAGLAAATVRSLHARAAAAVTKETPYEEAYRLLSQLYSVTRQLPGSLDPVTIADRLLDALAGVAPFDRAAVLVRAKGDRLVPVAHRAGGERLDWDTSLRGDSLISEAWASETPQVRSGMLAGSSVPEERRAEAARYGSTLVLPIRIGVRTFGVAALDIHTPGAYPEPVVQAVEQVVREAALRLATGLLFDEVREVATAEERRRLAREIHDGIAQELASIGYLVDALATAAHKEQAPGVARELGDLRRQITRLVSEVRLSIFDLRSDVDRHGGLGAALSEYVRTIGTSSDLTVHLTLDEEPRRLPAESEAELLRIAQEAINNARRHAGASNLWVTCRVDPPMAQIVVEDDGRGLGSRRADSFGLDMMRERAARLHARLEVGRREARGTRVEVVVGQPWAARNGGPDVGGTKNRDPGGIRANDSAAG